MTRLGSMVLGLSLSAGVALAQNQTSPEQLQKMYDDALVQLKAAQDRKNELAIENQKLQKRLSDTEQQLTATREQLATLENRAYFLHAHYQAWQDFIELNPSIRVMWSSFFNSATAPRQLSDLLGDGRWPFGID